ncbi:hypothetical protein AAY473_003887 [Plecturocebus cupreus]
MPGTPALLLALGQLCPCWCCSSITHPQCACLRSPFPVSSSCESIGCGSSLPWEQAAMEKDWKRVIEPTKSGLFSITMCR